MVYLPYIWLKCMVTVGKYTNPMDSMGHIDSVVVFGKPGVVSKRRRKKKRRRTKMAQNSVFVEQLFCVFFNGI